MNSNTKMEKFLQKAMVISSGMFLGASVASAAPGQIASQPLFVGKTPQSNIMFLVDDSGSMGWEYLITNNAAYNANTSLYRCTAINAMWYNANLYREKAADPANDTREKRLAYTPWRGVDVNGNEYTDRTLTTATRDPHGDPYNYRNVRDWYFYEWVDEPEADGKGNGRYDPGECKTNKRIYARDLPAEQQIDFANWYTYYRKRDFVAKRALSQIIIESNARMGLATLHNNDYVGIPVKNIDDLSTPIDTDNRTNKNDLMQSLFEIRPSGGTPLRRSLERVGKYFHQNQSTPSSLFGGATPSSPILPASENGACQQNFAVVMSDGFWNGSRPNVGNADRDNNTNFDGGNYADDYSNTLADVAMHYYEGDLAPGLPDLVGPKPSTDPLAPQPDPLLNRAQHLVSYTVAFGVNGTLEEPPVNGNWPQPVSNQSTTIDDMLHAAYNSRGEFLSAKNPQELIQRLSDAINSIKSKVGSSAGIALNSSSISSDSAVFKAVFAPEKSWSGDLIRQKLERNSNGDFILTDEWSAAEKLKSVSPDARQILTFNGTKGVPFRFPSDYVSPSADTELSAGQIEDLLYDAPHASAATATQINENKIYGERLLSYLRGEHTYERGVANSATILSNFNKVFRDRVGERLGDIAHSTPEFVAGPKENYPDKIEGEESSKSYVAFAKSKQNRRKMVYVGANDGMLHGFDAENGDERFAYVPSLMFNENAAFGLHYLSSVNYSHIPYVDGAITVRDVYVNGGWKSYLVGALRGGGRGIYVLDVTNPDSVNEGSAASKVVKEFTHDDLGFTFSEPAVVRLNDGRWAAVMGNGYNSGPNSDGHAKLFVVYLDDQTPSYRILETKNSGDADLIAAGNCEDVDSDCNGMSSPLVLDLDSDYIADRAYAGDLHGNMWAFDLSNSNPNEWKVAHKNGGNKQPLFTACYQSPCNSNGKVANRQPITSMPVVKSHRFRLSQSHVPSLLVYFGTGQFIANGDQAIDAPQSAYGVWDSGEGGLTRSNLQAQSISSGADSRTLSNNAVDYDDALSEAGWLIDLPADRERIINSFVVGSSVVVFGSIIPDAATCEGDPSGFLMAVDAFTGGEPPFEVFTKANIGSVPLAGIRLDNMPGALSPISDTNGDTKVAYADQEGNVQFITLKGSGSPARVTSWTTLK
ncbi:pilus assembly protein [Pseudoteredinibacter isoporae]|uniref:pilus assembly protein n=1 Tax=Pseudoteredinibacter isoporae TaxID=570281 RepID=UPI00310C2D94